MTAALAGAPTGTLEVTHLLALLTHEADARAELARLSTVCGWGSVDAEGLEVIGRSIADSADLAAARRFNGSIRSVLWASRNRDRIEAFAGPAFVRDGNPLLSIDDRSSRVQFAGAYRAGGPQDDSTAAVRGTRVVTTPSTEWLVRVQFPGVAPHADSISALLATTGLHTVSSNADRNTHWHRIAAAPRARVDRAAAELRTRHRVTLTTIRAL